MKRDEKRKKKSLIEELVCVYCIHHRNHFTYTDIYSEGYMVVKHPNRLHTWFDHHN